MPKRPNGRVAGHNKYHNAPAQHALRIYLIGCHLRENRRGCARAIRKSIHC
jgi:hypothetical protein